MNHLPPVLLAGLMAVSFPPAPPAGLMDTSSTIASKLAAAASFKQNLGVSVPLDVNFHDESGRTVPLGAFFGQRPVILVLGYHECPMLCSLVLSGLVESLTEMRASTGRDFDLIDVSINPSDSPEVADKQRRMYFRRYLRTGAEDGWHFLTSPDDASIHRLADAVGFRYAYDPVSKQYSHPAGLIVLTPEGKISRYFFGVTFDAGQLQAALAQAGQQRVGSRIEELLLVCFHYNPIHGKYGALIMTIIRAASVVTVLSLGLLVASLVRRERMRASTVLAKA